MIGVPLLELTKGMLPQLPGRRIGIKAAAFGLIAGLPVLLTILPLAGAGYFGMQSERARPAGVRGQTASSTESCWVRYTAAWPGNVAAAK